MELISKRQRHTVHSHWIILGLLLFVSALHSQPQNRGEMMTSRLKEKLSLTDGQVKKVQSVFDKAAKQADQDREQHQGDRNAMRESAMKRMQTVDSEIEKILTPDQKVKYEEMKKERQQQRRDRMQEK